MAFTDVEKLREVEREIDFRRWVYKKKIDAKKMTVAEAQRGIQLMMAIAEDYRQRVRPDPDLFGGRR